MVRNPYTFFFGDSHNHLSTKNEWLWVAMHILHPAPWVIDVSPQSANTAGLKKKFVALISLVTILYAAGNPIGPQIFLARGAPEYTSGAVAMITCVCMCIHVMLLVLAYLVEVAYENRSRDREFARQTKQVSECC